TDSAGTTIAGARVTIEGTALVTGTGTTGRYIVTTVPAGPRTVTVRVLGYRPQSQSVTVTGGQTTTLNFRLGRAPVELETIVSTGYATQTKATITGAADVVGGEEIQ